MQICCACAQRAFAYITSYLFLNSIYVYKLCVFVNGFIFLLRLFSFHYHIVVQGRTGFLIDVHEFDRSVLLHCRLFNVRHADSTIQQARHQLVPDTYGDRIQIHEVRIYNKYNIYFFIRYNYCNLLLSLRKTIIIYKFILYCNSLTKKTLSEIFITVVRYYYNRVFIY